MKIAVFVLAFLAAGLASSQDPPKEEEVGGAQILTMEPAPAAPPVSAPATLAGVKAGMTWREVVAKLGRPASKVEVWTYGSGAEAVSVTFRAGKVVSITRTAQPPAPKPPETPDVVVIE